VVPGIYENMYTYTAPILQGINPIPWMLARTPWVLARTPWALARTPDEVCTWFCYGTSNLFWISIGLLLLLGFTLLFYTIKRRYAERRVLPASESRMVQFESRDWLGLPLQDLTALLTSDDLRSIPTRQVEKLVAVAGLRWIRHDEEARRAHLSRVLRCVRMRDLNLDELTDIALLDEGVMMQDAEATDLLNRAAWELHCRTHQLPLPREIPVSRTSCLARARNRKQEVSLVLAVSEPLCRAQWGPVLVDATVDCDRKEHERGDDGDRIVANWSQKERSWGRCPKYVVSIRMTPRHNQMKLVLNKRGAGKWLLNGARLDAPRQPAICELC